MKPSHLLTCILAACCGSAFAAAAVSYDELVKNSQGSGSVKSMLGKTVQVVAIGKGEHGYFARQADDITFACLSGDKTLAGHKAPKGVFQGVLADATGWDGVTIWSLKDCQFVGTAAAAGGTVAKAAAGAKRSYLAGNKRWAGSVDIAGDDRQARVAMESSSDRGATCSVAGTAQYITPVLARFKAADDPGCTADLRFASAVLTVKSQGCNDFCGAAGPGFDHAYTLKP